MARPVITHIPQQATCGCN